jgi:hypothetical protein
VFSKAVPPAMQLIPAVEGKMSTKSCRLCMGVLNDVPRAPGWVRSITMGLDSLTNLWSVPLSGSV